MVVELPGGFAAPLPIKIVAVSKEEFETWTQQAQEQFARADGGIAVADRQASR